MLQINKFARFALSGRYVSSSDTRPDGNTFTLIRLVLASTVIFSHAFALTGHKLDDPSLRFLPYPVSGVAVLLFFSLSGFLVTGGLLRNGAKVFAMARARRLVPGLAVMLVVTIILGGAFTSEPLGTYLRSPSTRIYLIRNLLFLGHAYRIDTVFASNAMPAVMNGSLWTIPNEVRFYAALALAATLRLLSSRARVLVGFVVVVAVQLAFPASFHPEYAAARRLAVSFIFGVTLYLWRDRVFLSVPLATLTSLLALAIPTLVLRDTAIYLAATYVMLVVAFLAPSRIKALSAAAPDYSYGVYIYAFPVQQAVVALGMGKTPYQDMMCAAAVVICFAAASWHLVERPMMYTKPKPLRHPSRSLLGTGGEELSTEVKEG